MRVALTGGSTGIGAAVVANLNAAGHTVTVFDISEPAEPVEQYVRLDLRSAESIEAALATITRPFNALINNAGVPPREGQAELVLGINTIGLRQFMNGMLEHLVSSASIVNTASKAGANWLENIDQVKALLALDQHHHLAAFIDTHNIDHVRAYNLSKEALIALTIQMTEKLHGKGIRINAVSPAAVSTDILADFKTAFGDKVTANLARVGRPGEASEIAEVICFLASDKSRWIQGQNITVDGGMTAMSLNDQYFS